MIRKDDKEEINVSIIGDYYSGKSKLFNLMFGLGLDTDQMTLSIFQKKKLIEINGVKYKLNIYDTPGHVTKVYEKLLALKFSDIIIFIFRTGQFNTFEAIKLLLNGQCQNKAQKQIYESLSRIYEKDLDESIYQCFGLIGNRYNNDDFFFNFTQENEVKEFANSINAIFKKMSLIDENSEDVNDFLKELVKLYINNKIEYKKNNKYLGNNSFKRNINKYFNV